MFHKRIQDTLAEIIKLKERLNNKIIVSSQALATEMAEIHAYLFTDSEGPNVKYIDSESRAKLEAYLALLKSYYSFEKSVFI